MQPRNEFEAEAERFVRMILSSFSVSEVTSLFPSHENVGMSGGAATSVI